MSPALRYRFTFRATAGEHELQLCAGAAADARAAADAAIADVARIEAKYSRYRDESLTTRINRAAGGAPVPIDCCHLLDPSTAMPVAHWRAISVVAPLAIVAGSLATIAMLLESRAEAFLAAQDAAWLAIDAGGAIKRLLTLGTGA